MNYICIFYVYLILYMWYTVLEDNPPWSLMFPNNDCLCSSLPFQECLWCFPTVVLKMTLENPLDSKEIKPINPKGNQSWIFTGRTDAEAEPSILWLLLLLSYVSHVRLCETPKTAAHQTPVPGILQARTLEWVAISFSSAWKWKVKVKSLRRIWLFEIPWTAAYQSPPSMGFPRQEYWSGLPLPSPILWLPLAKSWFIGKDPDAGKDWGQEEKGATENEMVKWCHQLNGYEFEQTPGDGKDSEAWGDTVLGVAKSQIRLSD